jgi:hypothetical protein
MDQWLIRTVENAISGPYTKEQVCQLILDGELGVQDEVCQANGYWIFLHEREEVMRQLGVEVSLKASSDEEITDTHSVSSLERTDPDLSQSVVEQATSSQITVVERTSMWRGLAWSLIVVVCLVVFVVLRLLRET